MDPSKRIIDAVSYKYNINDIPNEESSHAVTEKVQAISLNLQETRDPISDKKVVKVEDWKGLCDKAVREMNRVKAEGCEDLGDLVDLFDSVKVGGDAHILRDFYQSAAVCNQVYFFQISPESIAKRQLIFSKSMSYFEKALEIKGNAVNEELVTKHINGQAAIAFMGMSNPCTRQDECLLKRFLENAIDPEIKRLDEQLQAVFVDNISLHFGLNGDSLTVSEAKIRVSNTYLALCLKAPTEDKRIEHLRQSIWSCQFLIRNEIPLLSWTISAAASAYAILAYYEKDETVKKKLLEKREQLQWKLNIPSPFGQSLKTHILGKQQLCDMQFKFEKATFVRTTPTIPLPPPLPPPPKSMSKA